MSMLISSLVIPAWAQIHEETDSVIIRNVNRADCPAVLLSALHEDSLRNKAALFFINDSQHPLGRSEFQDNRKPIKYLKRPVRMNRITLVYIPAGVHQFQTLYMKKFEEVSFQRGEIYIAALITTSTWPVPYALVKEDRFGREYVPVLFMYITGKEASQLIEGIKNKEVIIANN